ncbi:MAG: NupC/NupG family nucleoside CNT transporter, partial [Ignavibacteria bacterium]|nr:NupC/NupG family nucleoside CNT transporter [Ignavibacteria bacterium]
MDFTSVIRGIIGIIILLGIAFLISNNKKRINWRLVLSGLAIQITLAIFIIKGDQLGQFFGPLGWIKEFFRFVSSFFVLILNFTTEGAKFV